MKINKVYEFICEESSYISVTSAKFFTHLKFLLLQNKRNLNYYVLLFKGATPLPPGANYTLHEGIQTPSFYSVRGIFL